MRRRTFKGFTLIELMLVVAIIGLLAAIALPKFAGLIQKARDAAARGGLGTLRASLQIYILDNDGRYPWTYVQLVPKYLDKWPSINLTHHDGWSRGLGDGPFPCCAMVALFQPSTMEDALVQAHVTELHPFWPAPWGNYQFVALQDPTRTFNVDAAFTVLCTHTDARGVLWSEY